jgi:hypothetical protein
MGKLKAQMSCDSPQGARESTSHIAILTLLEAFCFAFEFAREKHELLNLIIATISTHIAIFRAVSLNSWTFFCAISLP